MVAAAADLDIPAGVAAVGVFAAPVAVKTPAHFVAIVVAIALAIIAVAVAVVAMVFTSILTTITPFAFVAAAVAVAVVAVATVQHAHGAIRTIGATLAAHQHPRGQRMEQNAGLRVITGTLVAIIDSDGSNLRHDPDAGVGAPGQQAGDQGQSGQDHQGAPHQGPVNDGSGLHGCVLPLGLGLSVGTSLRTPSLCSRGATGPQTDEAGPTLFLFDYVTMH
jgi:hypothetical protein